MYDGITAPFYYEGIIAKLIADFKFHGQEYLAKPFAKEMAESVKNDFENIDFDLVCYVPFTKNQKRRYFYYAGFFKSKSCNWKFKRVKLS